MGPNHPFVHSLDIQPHNSPKNTGEIPVFHPCDAQKSRLEFGYFSSSSPWKLVAPTKNLVTVAFWCRRCVASLLRYFVAPLLRYYVNIASGRGRGFEIGDSDRLHLREEFREAFFSKPVSQSIQSTQHAAATGCTFNTYSVLRCSLGGAAPAPAFRLAHVELAVFRPLVVDWWAQKVFVRIKASNREVGRTGGRSLFPPWELDWERKFSRVWNGNWRTWLDVPSKYPLPPPSGYHVFRAECPIS